MQANEPTVRIPVRVTAQGNLEFLYGGPIPQLQEGAVGDLIIPVHAVQHPYHLALLQRERIFTLFPEQTRLLVQMSDRSRPNLAPSRIQAAVRIETMHIGRPPAGLCVEVELQQEQEILFHGTKPGELMNCECFIPALMRRAASLNECYTLISEVYEPHRRSHTGNVFEKVWFYADDMNGWLPLRDRRDEIEAQVEHELFILCQPWWYRQSSVGGTHVWACLESQIQGTVTIHLVSSMSRLVASHYFARRDDAMAWLESESFQQYDPNSPGLATEGPPVPPYRRPDGSAIHIRPDRNPHPQGTG